ncbi:cupin domain-containing protein [Alteromonas sp. 5E99-2]|uniref:cupin domain-containing protein n=1 Tax=Alteromonas sp. 5E99-2 TaxID=2817683 RepID=UPI001A97FCE7|nr:cupin domain-containing protein [Alteromonas sp. 5E99-2]MBO1256108.1 cupin domain-containing protein [Alteromonas sp. 5E99-2]
MQKPVNLIEKFTLFSDLYSPKVVAEMNDYQFKLARIEGEFVWHSHAETDEVFIVLEGKLTIELRDRTIHLNDGEMFVVPKGVEHKPSAIEQCKVMLVEPKGTINTGETNNTDLIAQNDVWI